MQSNVFGYTVIPKLEANIPQYVEELTDVQRKLVRSYAEYLLKITGDKKSLNLWMILLVVVIALLLVGICIMFYFILKRKQKQNDN